MSLDPVVRAIAPSREYGWAFSNFKSSLIECAGHLGKPTVLEVGGGRSPFFSQEEILDLFNSYTVNDIAIGELDRAPSFVAKTCFDISGTIEQDRTYDLIFSRMVFEHVRDARSGYENLYALLNPGGIAINFIPTLMSPPFLLNKLLPEALTRRALRFFFPIRNENEIPKFPAYYDWSFSTQKIERRIEDIGYSDVKALPFYGHGYFEKIPVVRQLDDALSSLAERRDIRLLSTFAYMIMEK